MGTVLQANDVNKTLACNYQGQTNGHNLVSYHCQLACKLSMRNQWAQSCKLMISTGDLLITINDKPTGTNS